MTKAGERIIAGAQEALAYARGQSDLRASLSPGDRVGPNGEYVVVPVEPTPEMKSAAFESAKRTMPIARAKGVAWDAVVSYSAMLTALKEQDE